jgi:di/tricarboxylate transporter
LNELEFREGDSLLLKTVARGVKQLQETKGIELPQQETLGLTDFETESSVLMEGVIGPRSTMVGHTVRDLNFRQKYGALILAIHRQGVNLQHDFETVQLAFGDTLLVEGPASGIQRLMEARDFVSLTEPRQRAFRPRRAPVAIGAVVSVVVLSVLGVIPIAVAAILASVAVVLFRCIESQEVYEAVEWKVVFLIFGMLAIGTGVENSGLAGFIAEGTIDLMGGLGPVVMISVVYLITAVMTEFITNNATAVLLTPLVMAIASKMGVDPRPFLVAVMFGASASFVTPIGYQTNTYVYGAGGYRFADFPRVGLPLNIILWVVASFCIPWLWPVEPAP